MKGASLVLALALLLAVPATSRADGAVREYGPQFGFSTDPGQVVVGGHLSLGDVAPDLDFVPSLDLGFGDGLTVFSLNGDFHYRFRLSGATWQPYAGAGVSLHHASADNGGFGGSATVGGGSLIGGAEVPTSSGNRFYVEARFGVGDGPSFKALAGWSFPVR